MSVVVIMNLTVKEESLDEVKKYFKEILPDTRSFDGCEGVQLYESKEKRTKLTIHAKWVSEEAQKKYIEWRMETGALEKLMPMLSDPPSMQMYGIVDE